MKRLLIIPATLGSKRIKEKNIKKFFGKPIIYYSIQLALKSGLFNKIHVSTESKKIKNIVEKFGLKIDFLRNKKLSTNRVKLIDVFRHVVKKFKLLGESFDQIEQRLIGLEKGIEVSVDTSKSQEPPEDQLQNLINL